MRFPFNLLSGQNTKTQDAAYYLSTFDQKPNLSLTLTKLPKSKNTGDVIHILHPPPHNSCADEGYHTSSKKHVT